jgi:CheY-like chemotaxis protein
VLLDLNLPGMDGDQFLDRLGAEADTPAIVLTSMILDSHQRKRLGRAAKIVSKSDLSSPVLIAAISGAIAKKELAR